MTERKPPPMYAVWNENSGVYATHPAVWRETAERQLERMLIKNRYGKFRIVTLIPQPEPPQ